MVDLTSDMAENREIASKLSTFPSLKSSLYRARQSRLHILPQHREDIHIVGQWEKSLSGEQFLLCEEGDADKLIIFATRRNMNLLAEAKTIYVDGTFEVCPKLFYQLFTINAFIHGQKFSLVYCLERQEKHTKDFLCA